MNKYQLEIAQCIKGAGLPQKVSINKREFISYLEKSDKWQKCHRGYMTTNRKIVYTLNNHRVGLNY